MLVAMLARITRLMTIVGAFTVSMARSAKALRVLPAIMNGFLPCWSASLPNSSWNRLMLRMRVALRNPSWSTVAPVAMASRFMNRWISWSLYCWRNAVVYSFLSVVSGVSSWFIFVFLLFWGFKVIWV